MHSPLLSSDQSFEGTAQHILSPLHVVHLYNGRQPLLQLLLR